MNFYKVAEAVAHDPSNGNLSAIDLIPIIATVLPIIFEKCFGDETPEFQQVRKPGFFAKMRLKRMVNQNVDKENREAVYASLINYSNNLTYKNYAELKDF